MSPHPDGQEQLHPIQVVARRTGLTPDVLRAWERRYQAIRPTRSHGSRRLYSDGDVERLILLRRATTAGRSIGQVARLTTERLRALVAEDKAAVRSLSETEARSAPPLAGPELPSPNVESILASCLKAVGELDAPALEASVGRALLALSPLVASDSILVPLMREIGASWSHGSMGIVHEHMASAVVRTILGSIARSHPSTNGAPSIVVATPSGAHHELGALMAVVTATACGWLPTYLGPNLPAREIAAGADQRAAKAIALGITFPPADPGVSDELLCLRKAAPHTSIIVGGDAAASYGSTLDLIRARRHASMSQLRETLAEISPEARR